MSHTIEKLPVKLAVSGSAVIRHKSDMTEPQVRSEGEAYLPTYGSEYANGFDLRLIRHVAGLGDGAGGTGVAAGGKRRFCIVGTQIHQYQMRAFGREAPRAGQADAAQAAGNDDGAIVETLCRRHVIHHSRRLPSRPRQTGLRQAWGVRAASRTLSSSMSTPSPGPSSASTMPSRTSNTCGLRR